MGFTNSSVTHVYLDLKTSVLGWQSLCMRASIYLITTVVYHSTSLSCTYLSHVRLSLSCTYHVRLSLSITYHGRCAHARLSITCERLPITCARLSVTYKSVIRWSMVVHAGVWWGMVEYGGVCMVVYGGVWWCTAGLNET